MAGGLKYEEPVNILVLMVSMMISSLIRAVENLHHKNDTIILKFAGRIVSTMADLSFANVDSRKPLACKSGPVLFLISVVL